jgi:general stress protein 26
LKEDEVHPELLRALRIMHRPDGWVDLGTVGKGGWPHVAPVMMGIRDDVLLFSLTGKQKKRNIERDPRVCVALSRPADLAHVIVWGQMQLRHDAEAQELWNGLIEGAFGPEGLAARRRELSLDGTSLGVLVPVRHRTYRVLEASA